MTNLPTTNTAWGFWGTIAHNTDPAAAWRLAMAKVAEAIGMADEVANHLTAGRDLEAAIDIAVETWMGWRVSRRTARETGIPQSLSYLTGLVGQMEADADA
jgi:hypothetical protein